MAAIVPPAPMPMIFIAAAAPVVMAPVVPPMVDVLAPPVAPVPAPPVPLVIPGPVLDDGSWLLAMPCVPCIKHTDYPIAEQAIYQWMEANAGNIAAHQVFNFNEASLVWMSAARKSIVMQYLQAWHLAFINSNVPWFNLQPLWTELMKYAPGSSNDRMNSDRARSMAAFRLRKMNSIGMHFNHLDTWPRNAIWALRRQGMGFWSLFSLALPLYRADGSILTKNPRQTRQEGSEFTLFKHAAF